MASGQYRLVILDEANLGPMLRLFSVEELLALVDARPDGVELVLTGRGADRRLLERADLVTEMQEIKHYYRQGVLARTGSNNSTAQRKAMSAYLSRWIHSVLSALAVPVASQGSSQSSSNNDGMRLNSCIL